MAKSKTARKGSGTTKDKKTTKKGGEKPSKSQKAPKSSELLCEHCQKPMKDIKTKKLHERNCKKKKIDKGKKKPATKKDKDFDSALREMKDEFEDQRHDMEEKYQEREEKLHRELGEIKEVLRLEMEHRHKERARIKKEEAAKVEDTPRKPAPPEARSPESQTVQPPVSTAAQLPEPMMVQAPTVRPEDIPRAIDRIPVPIPTIPERKAREPERPIVEVVELGNIGPMSEDVTSQKIELQREEIMNIIREEMEAFSLKHKEEEKKEALPELDGLRKDVQDLTSQLADVKRNIEDMSSKKTPNINLTMFEQDFKRIDRELNKFSEKIVEIMEEIGFGESLSVSKIPPTILEIVYQATLDDLTKELVKTVGNQDAEKISRSALEEVRLKTSGSELFKFDGRKIVTDNLAKTLEGDLISAKQIQTTYEELLGRFLENLPHHKAKNFRSMIKVKSQEFAVDRATMLTKDFERMHKHFESTDQMLAALSAQVSAKHLKIEEEVQEIREKLLADKADLSDIEMLKVKLKEREEREATIMKDMGLLKAEAEMKKELTRPPKKKPEKKDVKEPEKKEKKIEKKDEKKPEEVEDATDIEENVLEAISGGASSKTALKKRTELDEKVILDTISKLVKENKVVEKKVGIYLSYQTPERAFKEKLDAKVKGEKKAPPKKSKKPSKKPDASKVKKDEKEKGDTISKKKKVEKKEKAEDKDKKGTKEKLEKAKPDKKKKENVKKTKSEEKKKEDKAQSKEKKPDIKKKPEEEPEKETESPARTEKEVAEKVKEITMPSESKSLDELSEDERKVLEVITESGLTRTGIQSKVGKDMKYTSVLRALRVLIDSGYVGILTKGRMTIYQKLKVEKVEKTKKEENKTEVK